MRKSLFSMCLWGLATFSAMGMEFILPEHPMSAEQTAADELKERFSSCFDTLVIGGTEITQVQLGNTPENIRRFGELQDEEWRVESEGEVLFLAGGGPRGTYYAAAHFMEDQMDIHIWNLFEEYVPERKSRLELPALKAGGKPAFFQRNVFHETCLPRDKGHFAAFNRLNVMGSHALTAAYGGSRIIGSPSLCHTFDPYFPEGEFFKEHPEYYAMIGGKRVPGAGSQLCLSNPEVLEIAWKKMQNYILEDEKKAAAEGIEPPSWYDFSPNDNGQRCHCPDCERIVQEEGTDSGLLQRVVRELALRLKTFRPKLYVTTLAYWNNEEVPAKVRPPENLIVRLCNTSQNQVTPISAPGSAVFRKKLSDWGKVAKVGFWEYGITCYDTYFESKPCYPNEFNMAEQYRFYHENNAFGAFCELQSPEYSDMHELKAFMLAKLFENPYQDGEKLRMLFLEKYYGKASPYIDEYRRTLRDSAKAHNSQCFTYNIFPANFTYFDFDTSYKCYQLLQKALETAGEDAVLARRVRRARLNLDNALLVHYRQILKDYLEKGGRRQDFPMRYDVIRNRYREERIEALKFNFSHNPDYVEGMIATMDKRLNMMSALPMVYPDEKTNPEWIEIAANIAGCFRNELVYDRESPIGFAAFAEYAVSPQYLDLPMGCGGYDNATMGYIYGVSLDVKDVAGPGYHWYRTPAFVPRHAGLAYILNNWTFQVPMGPAVAASRENSNRAYYCYYSIKFVGQRYYKKGRKAALPTRKQKEGIYFDRAFLVPVDVPFTLGPYRCIGGEQGDKTTHTAM